MGCCDSCLHRFLDGYQEIVDSAHHPAAANQQHGQGRDESDSRNKYTQTSEKITPSRIHGLNTSIMESVIVENDLGLPPEFLKLYRIGSLVGIGTTAKVYAIYHRRRKHTPSHIGKLACKVIDKRKLTLGMDTEDVEPLLKQLRKEIDILKRIHHENIVAFYDCMETRDRLFIITEHLTGGELFDHIINFGPLQEESARKVLYGVFSAVAYLHDRGVIHRDIKAENLIFFYPPGGELSLKLIDFGFSTILRHDLTGSFMGTGGYIAPEIRQNKAYNMSVDTWSLGVLLYCTLSAKLPFDVSVEELPRTTEHCEDFFVLRFPPNKWQHISASCKDLISQLLQIDPIKRITCKRALTHPWFRAEHTRAMKGYGAKHVSNKDGRTESNRTSQDSSTNSSPPACVVLSSGITSSFSPTAGGKASSNHDQANRTERPQPQDQSQEQQQQQQQQQQQPPRLRHPAARRLQHLHIDSNNTSHAFELPTLCPSLIRSQSTMQLDRKTTPRSSYSSKSNSPVRSTPSRSIQCSPADAENDMKRATGGRGGGHDGGGDGGHIKGSSGKDMELDTALHIHNSESSGFTTKESSHISGSRSSCGTTTHLRCTEGEEQVGTVEGVGIAMIDDTESNNDQLLRAAAGGALRKATVSAPLLMSERAQLEGKEELGSDFSPSKRQSHRKYNRIHPRGVSASGTRGVDGGIDAIASSCPDVGMAFIWEEMHDKMAGDLFFTTYQHQHHHRQQKDKEPTCI